MTRPLLLWFDCTSRRHDAELRRQFATFFEMAYRTHIANADQEINLLAPRVLCFDFDYPHQGQLRSMQSIKQKHISLPTLMFTVEHSEALAVWAFRARVWNYLVKPVATEELLENLHVLLKIAASAQRGSRALTLSAPAVPNQVPTHSANDTQSMLRPGISFVEQHFNEKLAADDVAQHCGMDRFRFSRLFRRAFGVTFQEYLLLYRVRQACTLLQRPRASVMDVGHSVGFNDPSHFSPIFKRYMRMLPSEYALTTKAPALE